jgi:hypothetical protein
MPSLSKRLMQHVASPLMRLGAGRPFLRARELILGLPQRPNARATSGAPGSKFSATVRFTRLGRPHSVTLGLAADEVMGR